jgi:hypothetical protein
MRQSLQVQRQFVLALSDTRIEKTGLRAIHDYQVPDVHMPLTDLLLNSG